MKELLGLFNVPGILIPSEHAKNTFLKQSAQLIHPLQNNFSRRLGSCGKSGMEGDSPYLLLFLLQTI